MGLSAFLDWWTRLPDDFIQETALRRIRTRLLGGKPAAVVLATAAARRPGDVAFGSAAIQTAELTGRWNHPQRGCRADRFQLAGSLFCPLLARHSYRPLLSCLSVCQSFSLSLSLSLCQYVFRSQEISHILDRTPGPAGGTLLVCGLKTTERQVGRERERSRLLLHFRCRPAKGRCQRQVPLGAVRSAKD